MSRDYGAMTTKQNIAVLFGGPTVEHEVTVVTAHEVIRALDPTRFNVLPLYWAPDGQLYTGAALLDRTRYPFGPDFQRAVTPVHFRVFEHDAAGRVTLVIGRDGLFSKAERFALDCVVPVAHGTFVEDGNMQGLLTSLGVPFTGPGTFAASLFMNKMATKQFLSAYGVPVLPATLVQRPRDGSLPDYAKLARDVQLPGDFPLIVKPNYLGSSVGVTRATTIDELAAGIATVFKFDTAAIIEPCVTPLVEYNVSVTQAFGGIRTSAIEKPMRKSEVLDFTTKYIGDGAKKAGGKKNKAGMRFSGRELDPTSLTAIQRDIIISSAHKVMTATMAKGAPRIDFISNEATGEIWLNEVNPVPGDFASFLWDAAEQPKTFTELLTALIGEAQSTIKADARLTDPGAAGAKIFKR